MRLNAIYGKYDAKISFYNDDLGQTVKFRLVKKLRDDGFLVNANESYDSIIVCAYWTIGLAA